MHNQGPQDASAWNEFTGVAQVAQLRRTVTRKGKKTIEVVYLATSTDAPSANCEPLATWANTQWAIEIRLHWVWDVTFDEDPL